MRKILLASAGVMVISAGTVYAACIPAPSCSSLGYESSSSCEGGIKCPFGNAWNCTVINKVNEITNKVTELEKVVEEGGGGNSSCQVGYLYFSDKTCSAAQIPSKTPIGVVAYIDGKGHGQVIAIDSVLTTVPPIWGGKDTDIPTLTNYSTAKEAATDFASCSNTEKILAAGDKSKYPAAWAAHEYKTEGTEAGDWCLPAAGILHAMYLNRSLVANGLSNASSNLIIAAGIKIISSTEQNSSYIWQLDIQAAEGFGLGSLPKGSSALVVPVLEF